MRHLPIPKEDQISALLERRFAALVGEYVQHPDSSMGKYITISKPEALKFLKDNPKLLKEYFEFLQKNRGFHDVFVINRVNSSYEVAWMDHGVARFPRHHSVLEE